MTTRMTTARSTTEKTDEHAHITTHSWPQTGGGGEQSSRQEGRVVQERRNKRVLCERGDEGKKERE